MKTTIERINEILNSKVDVDKDSLEKLVLIAYYYGAETAAKRVSDKYTQHMREQNKRAEACRYYNMAKEILQNGHGYIWDQDYSGGMTEAFGSDETNL